MRFPLGVVFECDFPVIRTVIQEYFQGKQSYEVSCVDSGQEAELLKQVQRELESKQQLQHVLEAQLSEETASLTTTQARANALEAQLKDNQEINMVLQKHLQVCSAS